jgi:hypothetical protein
MDLTKEKGQMKKIISSVTIFTILLTALLIGIPSKPISISVNASQIDPVYKLFNDTNTFNLAASNPTIRPTPNNMSFNTNTRNSNTVMPAAQITVLTHGLGNHAGAWSNAERAVNEDGKWDRPFAHCEHSTKFAVVN